MFCRVTLSTERDQVLLDVLARVAAIFLMVYRHVAYRTAKLATPAIPSQYARTQVAITLACKPDQNLFLQAHFHWICSLIV
jgi:hypothetical protein